MSTQNSTTRIEEKIRQALEKLGEAVDGWLTRQGLKPQPVPIPIDRSPHRRKRQSRR